MKVWLRSKDCREIGVICASDGTVSDRQLLMAYRRLGVLTAEIVLRRGRHTTVIQDYSVPQEWLDGLPEPTRRHRLVLAKR